MTERLYEAHITYAIEDQAAVEKYHSPEWKFSAIDGDPVLGKKVFCYLTSYDANPHKLLDRMKCEADSLRYFSEVPGYDGAEPVRQKIERIVYDTKTQRDEVTLRFDEDV